MSQWAPGRQLSNWTPIRPDNRGESYGDRHHRSIRALAPQDGGGEGHVVEAHELTRRYGEGETAVDALVGVDLQVSAGS